MPAEPGLSQTIAEDQQVEDQGETRSREEHLVAEASLPRLTPVAGERRRLATPWRTESELERFEPALHLRPRARGLPLFDERWARELLTTLLQTEVPDAPPDEAAAVDLIARGRPLDPVPRLVRLSLRRGAQILVDVGDAMEPFAHDTWDLVSQVERLVGAGNLSTLTFWDAPLRGIGPKLERYVPPHPGRPVLVLSDVGIGGQPLRLERSQPGEWLRLRALLHTRGSPLIVFVPYRQARWPLALRQRLVLVEWDRTMTAARAHMLRSAWRERRRR
jgi:hypothetical protein